MIELLPMCLGGGGQIIFQNKERDTTVALIISAELILGK